VEGRKEEKKRLRLDGTIFSSRMSRHSVKDTSIFLKNKKRKRKCQKKSPKKVSFSEVRKRKVRRYGLP